MSTTGITRIQQVQMQSSVEGMDAARDAQDDAISSQEKYIAETRSNRMKEIQERADAREAEGMGRLFGTIFGGPIIGTLIGGAIGGAVGDSSEEAANAAKTAAGISDLKYDKATDRFKSAKDGVEDAQSKSEDLAKFSRELRTFGWAGTEQ